MIEQASKAPVGLDPTPAELMAAKKRFDVKEFASWQEYRTANNLPDAPLVDDDELGNTISSFFYVSINIILI